MSIDRGCSTCINMHESSLKFILTLHQLNLHEWRVSESHQGPTKQKNYQQKIEFSNYLLVLENKKRVSCIINFPFRLIPRTLFSVQHESPHLVCPQSVISHRLIRFIPSMLFGFLSDVARIQKNP